MLSPQQREELKKKLGDYSKDFQFLTGKELTNEDIFYWWLSIIDSILTEKQERIVQVPWCDLENGRGRYLLESAVINILKE